VGEKFPLGGMREEGGKISGEAGKGRNLGWGTSMQGWEGGWKEEYKYGSAEGGTGMRCLSREEGRMKVPSYIEISLVEWGGSRFFC